MGYRDSVPRSILIHDGQITRDIGLVYCCSGYG